MPNRKRSQGLTRRPAGEPYLDRRSLGDDAHVCDVHDALRERIHGGDVPAELHVREAELGAASDREPVRGLEGELDGHRELAQVDALIEVTARERFGVVPGHAEAVRRPETPRELHAVAQRHHEVPVPDRVERLSHLRRVAVARVRAETVEVGRGPDDGEPAALQREVIDEGVSGGVVEHREGSSAVAAKAPPTALPLEPCSKRAKPAASRRPADPAATRPTSTQAVSRLRIDLNTGSSFTSH